MAGADPCNSLFWLCFYAIVLAILAQEPLVAVHTLCSQLLCGQHPSIHLEIQLPGIEPIALF